MQAVFFVDGTQKALDATSPREEKYRLDEALDEASFSCEDTKIENPFNPLTPCEFSGRMWVVASDNAVLRQGTASWSHAVYLVEPTKWLERFIVGTKTVTQPITRTYEIFDDQGDNISGDALFSRTESGLLGSYIEYKKDAYFRIYAAGLFSIKAPLSICSIPSSTFYSASVKIFSNEEEIFKRSYSTEAEATDANINVILPPSSVTIKYAITCVSDSIYFGASSEYFLSVVDTTQAEPITLLDVAEDLLTIVEPLRAGETPRFSLSDSAKDKLRGIMSPEFTFTNNTLREALDEIGKVIGCIARLRIKKDGDAFVYEIDYDPFSTFELADTSKLGTVKAILRKQSVEQYCTTLDSTVDNLMEYNGAGTVMDPGPRSFRTVRTEDTSYQITEAGAVIYTQYPIEVLEKLEIGLRSSANETSDVNIKDATKYCFESAEYATLSSYSPAFPYSKAYALRYAFGQRNITSLAFEMESAANQIFKQPSLVNVINEIFGTSYSDFGLGVNHLDYNNVLFRVTYRPSVSARVITRKSLSDTPSALAFNQGAAKLDSTAFGRNACGNALRMGNAEETRKYTVRKDVPSSELPRCGQIMNDMVVSEVQRTSYASGFDEVVISLTKNFNRLSQYVGIDHSKRIYEISEKLGVDRYVNLEDVCVIGIEDGKTFDAGKIFATDSMGIYILGSLFLPTYDFSASMGGDIAVRRNFFAFSQGEDESGNKLSAVLLPVASYGMGTSLVFSWRYGDNYSAGTFVNEYEVDEVKSYAQSEARYVDLYGRIDKLGFKLLANRDAVSPTFLSSYTDRLEEGRLFPLVNDESTQTSGSNYITVAECVDDPVVIKKDNREALNVTYQVSFVGRDGLYVMPGLAEAMNAADPKNAKLYVLDHLVTPLTTTVDLTGKAGQSVIFSPLGAGKALLSATTGTAGSAIVIAKEDGEVLLAANRVVAAGDGVLINFDFVRPH